MDPLERQEAIVQLAEAICHRDVEGGGVSSCVIDKCVIDKCQWLSRF